MDSAVAFPNVNRPLRMKPPLLQEWGSGWRLLECACGAKAEMLLWGVSSAHRDEEGSQPNHNPETTGLLTSLETCRALMAQTPKEKSTLEPTCFFSADLIWLLLV